MKKQFIYIACLAFCLPAAAQTFSGGKGTKEEPWLISKAADIEELCRITDTPGQGDTQQTSGKYFQLTQDITEPVTTIIGLEGYFMGDFNGGGHCITLGIDMPSENYVGLFGAVKDGAVHDLAVKGRVNGRIYVGAIAASATNGARLYNLANFADVSSKSTSVLSCVGGIVGGIVSKNDATLGGAVVNNCANYGSVSCPGSAVGGVIGYSGQQTGNTINDIANYGNVESAATRAVAGVVGNPLWNDKVHRLANFGTMSSQNQSGCIGNANPTDLGEIFYDKQYSHITNGNSNQERNTTELTGTAMESSLGSTWAYEDGMLPRPQMNGLENSSAAILYATPAILADSDWLGCVTKDFSLSAGSEKSGKVTWTSEKGLVEIHNDGTVTLKGNGTETLTATLNGEQRTLTITIATPSGIGSMATPESNGRTVDNTWHNLNGQRIPTPKHGIFIINGKKVAVE